MKRNLSISSLLIAGALTGFTGLAGASTQNPGVGMRETSLPEVLFGRIEKIENNGFLVQVDRGQVMKLQLSNTNFVCSSGSEAKLMTDCNFKLGDLVRIELGTMTTITMLAYEQEEPGSQIATEKEEEPSTSAK